MENIAVSAYRALVQKGWRFEISTFHKHHEVYAYSPTGKHEGKLAFNAGELIRISAYSPAEGIGTAMVGSAMLHSPADVWYFTTSFRDENGLIFANTLAASLGDSIGRRVYSWGETFGSAEQVSFAVPRRPWILVRPRHTGVKKFGYGSEGVEGAAIARKLIQTAKGNHSEYRVTDCLSFELREAIEAARALLIDPPIAEWSHDIVWLDMKGHPDSYSPVPAVVSDIDEFEALHDGASPNAQTFLRRRGESLEAARLFY